jgi:hypothetical protein
MGRAENSCSITAEPFDTWLRKIGRVIFGTALTGTGGVSWWAFDKTVTELIVCLSIRRNEKLEEEI